MKKVFIFCFVISALVLAGCKIHVSSDNKGEKTSTGGTTAADTSSEDNVSTEDKASEGDTTGGNTEDSNNPNNAEEQNPPAAINYNTISSIEMAKALSVGWSLGNTLSACKLGTKENKGLSIETSWGQPLTTEEMIKTIHKAGFKTFRIPVSWRNHITDEDGYKVDTEWMARVKEVVDWAYNDGMFVIINMALEDIGSIDDLEKDKEYGYKLADKDTKLAVYNKSINYISSVWSQIAGTFNNDYDNKLIFEILYEPNDTLWREWNHEDNFYEKFNQCIKDYEKAVIDAVRATGGQNSNRFILVPGYNAGFYDIEYLDYYGSLPEDTASDKLLLSVHDCTPNGFCYFFIESHSTFTDEDKKKVDFLFNYLKTNYLDKSIGVVLSEINATDQDNTTEREAWATYYFNQMRKTGISGILHDNGTTVRKGSSPSDTENFGWFDRATLTWYYPSIVKKILDAMNITGDELKEYVPAP